MSHPYSWMKMLTLLSQILLIQFKKSLNNLFMNQSSLNAEASADSHGLLLWFFLVSFEAWLQKRKLKRGQIYDSKSVFLKWIGWNNTREKNYARIWWFSSNYFLNSQDLWGVTVSMDVSVSCFLKHTEGVLTAGLYSCWRFSPFQKDWERTEINQWIVEAHRYTARCKEVSNWGNNRVRNLQNGLKSLFTSWAFKEHGRTVQTLELPF